MDNTIVTISYVPPLLYLRVSVTQSMLPGTILIQKCAYVYIRAVVKVVDNVINIKVIFTQWRVMKKSKSDIYL